VTLAQEERISLGELDFVRIGLDVLAYLVEGRFPPQTKDGLVTHLLLHVIHLLGRPKASSDPATLASERLTSGGGELGHLPLFVCARIGQRLLRLSILSR